MRKLLWCVALTVTVVRYGAGAAGAHPAYLTAAELTVEPDGAFHGQVRFDTLAFALNDTSARIGNEPMESLLAGPAEELTAQLGGARDRFTRAFRVVTDAGDATVDRLDFPTAEDVRRWAGESRPVLPVVVPVRVSGRLPQGAHSVAARFPPVLEQVILTVQRPSEEPEAEPVGAGAVSTALAVRLAAPQEVAGGADPPMKSGRVLASVAILMLLSLLGIFRRRRPR